MSNVIFHSVEPESNKASGFNEFDTIDFLLSTDRNLVRNSVRLEGKLLVEKTSGQRATYTDRIYMKPQVGAHSIIEGVRVEVNGSVIQNVKSNYSRLVCMKETATKAPNDYYSGASLCELKAPSVDCAIAFACGESDNTDQAQAFSDLDFSFKPDICLNNMSDNLQMSRVNNEVRVSLNLARNANVLCGIGATTGSQYTITDLRLTFTTVPPSPVPQVSMDSVVDIKSVLQSANANISTRVPSIVSGVSISFLKQSKENQNHFEADALEKPPNIKSVQFLINDATNQMIQYEQKDYGEFLDGYLESLENMGVHQVNANTVKGNQVYGLGQKFGSAIDLSQSKFSVNLTSDVSNTNQYIMFLFFHSKISL
jgi:hypothetical protein